MVVLYVIGIGRVATSCERLDVVVLLVFLQRLVLRVGHHHLSIDAGRVGTWRSFCIERHRIVLLLLLAKVSQKTQLVEGLVLI